MYKTCIVVTYIVATNYVSSSERTRANRSILRKRVGGTVTSRRTQLT